MGGCNLLVTLVLVPTARLELAQLSPLPPQDSVSTNFTTSARLRIVARATSSLARADMNNLICWRARWAVHLEARQAPLAPQQQVQHLVLQAQMARTMPLKQESARMPHQARQEQRYRAQQAQRNQMVLLALFPG